MAIVLGSNNDRTAAMMGPLDGRLLLSQYPEAQHMNGELNCSTGEWARGVGTMDLGHGCRPLKNMAVRSHLLKMHGLAGAQRSADQGRLF